MNLSKIRQIFAVLTVLPTLVWASPQYGMTNRIFEQIASANTSPQKGEEQINAFKEVVQNNDFYALLMRLDATVPPVVRIGEYVTLLNEIHAMNQKLELILAELKKNKHP